MCNRGTTTFYVVTFPDSQRLRDQQARIRCALTAWKGPYPAAIVTGMARRSVEETSGRTQAFGDVQSYGAGVMVAVAVGPTRIFAICLQTDDLAGRPTSG